MDQSRRNKHSAEQQRLDNHYEGKEDWLSWGSYLSERQWGTVREDYSANGDVWAYFPFSHAHSRNYRWGEDGIAGICDRYCRLCFAPTFWNGNDHILKERLFGLSGTEGNHGEDVKELYYYLDNTPTHSFMKYLYKYPHSTFPYQDLIETNARRSLYDPEYEILDTGIFNHDAYFDIYIEYAKAAPEDILIKITAINRGTDSQPLTIIPTLWFRNMWKYKLIEEKPEIKSAGDGELWLIDHPLLAEYFFHFQAGAQREIFTENTTNNEKIFGTENSSPYTKDLLHEHVVKDQMDNLKDRTTGTKAGIVYGKELAGGEKWVIYCRLSTSEKPMSSSEMAEVFTKREQEADEFYKPYYMGDDQDQQRIQRQAFAGMLWTKQYYHLDIPTWLNGDPGMPEPPPGHKNGRNSNWKTLHNEDIISMPDKWEYPWYAAWDLGFHCVPIARIDPRFAKDQLILFLREWYMHPNGEMPAYEWNFSDVNPPVHAWACMQVYRIEQEMTGSGDIVFLKRVMQKLLINFTWWVNRKDRNNNNIFEGGFLGLDNIGIFDRSKGVPEGAILEQADGTSWMAMYCLQMLDMSLELTRYDNAYEDLAIKFLTHFVYIAESLNEIGENYIGNWSEEDGFFYDVLTFEDGHSVPLKIRSLVGLVPLFAVLFLDKERLANAPKFMEKIRWFRSYRMRKGLYRAIEYFEEGEDIMLSLLPYSRLERVLQVLLDRKEFYSPGGIRSLSKIHQTPYRIDIKGRSFEIEYEPGVSRTRLFGGNSNWRGPVWMPMNYLIITSLREYHKYYCSDPKACGKPLSVEGKDLEEIANDVCVHLISIFTKDAGGRRKVYGDEDIYADNKYFEGLILFYEYFHAETGEGLGASHQTGWTGIIAELIYDMGRVEEAAQSSSSSSSTSSSSSARESAM